MSRIGAELGRLSRTKFTVVRMSQLLSRSPTTMPGRTPYLRRNPARGGVIAEAPRRRSSSLDRSISERAFSTFADMVLFPLFAWVVPRVRRCGLERLERLPD